MRDEGDRLFQNPLPGARPKNRVYVYGMTSNCHREPSRGRRRLRTLLPARSKPTNILVGFAKLLSKSQSFFPLGRFSRTVTVRGAQQRRPCLSRTGLMKNF